MWCMWILVIISSCMIYAFPEKRIIVKDVSISRGGEITEGFFEGDIELPKFRSAIRYPGFKWPNGHVPYTISSDYSRTVRTIIKNAMHEIELNTKHGTTNCITFVARTNQADYLNIQRKNGCHSRIGRVGGAQELSLGTGCEHKGTIMHELMHALGFWHEQSRYDRDNYVTVHTDNIAADHAINFDKRTDKDVNLLGTSYDLGSIMHYGAYDFAVHKSRPVLTPKSTSSYAGVEMGQRVAMSTLDVERIQKLYGCTVDTAHITAPDVQSVVHCSFDTNLCKLQQDTHDNFDWIRLAACTPTAGTCPNADHTNGAGSYIYAEANAHHGQKARLLTPTAAGGEYCVIFWLFQHGSQEGVFNVLAAGPQVSEQTVYTVSGNQGAGWTQYRIPLTMPSKFHLILEACIGAGDSSNIAIDDFAMNHGECM